MAAGGAAGSALASYVALRSLDYSSVAARLSLAYAAGFMVAAYLLGRWRRAGLTPLRHALDESTLITAVMVGVITGGRLGHVLLYARDEFAADPAASVERHRGSERKVAFQAFLLPESMLAVGAERREDHSIAVRHRGQK